jgi:hypothetical protein
MRMGKVSFAISEIVDLDNPEMVEMAKDFILDDIMNVYKYEEDYNDYIVCEEDNTLTETDIPDWYEDIFSKREEKEDTNANIQNQ